MVALVAYGYRTVMIPTHGSAMEKGAGLVSAMAEAGLNLGCGLRTVVHVKFFEDVP